jgi:Tfp pilus assembly protein PilO
MLYKNLKLIAFLAFFLQINQTSAQFVPCERSYTVFFNPLLQKMVELKDYNGKIAISKSSDILPLNGSSFAPNLQELIKYNGKIYILLYQTGFIFQMSEPQGDSVVFKKLDNTININYNIGCTNFIYKDEIYNYGGYGFWSKFPHVRKYNKVDMEWDIQPTNIEVFSADYDWFSPKEGRLYVPFQKIENKALKDPKFTNGIFEYTSYYLDLKTTDWIKLGKATPELIKLINEKNNYASYAYENGRIFVINEKAYLFDYLNNKVYKSKKADLDQFFIRGALETTAFFYNGKFYKYRADLQSYKTWDFNINDFELLNFQIWGNDYMTLIFVLAICLVIILIIFFIRLFKQSVKKKIEQAQLKVLKTKTMNQAFTETEISLIQLLINASGAKQNIEIAEINRVLGIKDKNLGLQKKVRSDVINAINDKYTFITQVEINLIASIRKEDDKRFYEYFIVPTEVKTAQKLIEKN